MSKEQIKLIDQLIQARTTLIVVDLFSEGKAKQRRGELIIKIDSIKKELEQL